jgi:hypothetical protein
VDRYAESVDDLPPLEVFYDGVDYWLADGFHRVAALTQAGRDMHVAHVHQGTQRQAVLYACGANAEHGLPRTAADARRAVERVLSDEEWRSRSDRWIADMCRVSPTTVGRVRGEMGATSGTRTVQRGDQTYNMNVIKPGLLSSPGGQMESGKSSTPKASQTPHVEPVSDDKREGERDTMPAPASHATGSDVARRFQIVVTIDLAADEIWPGEDCPKEPRASHVYQVVEDAGGWRALGDWVLDQSYVEVEVNEVASERGTP